MKSLALQIIASPFLFAIVACVQTPYYRLPTAELPRRLMPCEMVPAGYPCQRPVVKVRVSECEKRFGAKLCNPGEKP